MQPHRKRVSDKLWQFGNDLDDCNRKIDENSRDIEQLYNPLKATCYDGMPHGSETSDITLETVAMIETKHWEVNLLSSQKDSIRIDFERYIEPLKHQQKVIIRLVYIDNIKPLWKVGNMAGYSERTVKRLLGDAQDSLK